MNIKQAKQVPITAILAHENFKQVKKHSGHEIWYENPLRIEKESSFSVNVKKNLWHDFGTGEGGNAFDFVLKHKKCSPREALKWLEENFGTLPLIKTSNRTQPSKTANADLFNRQENHRLKVVNTKPVSNPVLIEYLTKDRKLNLARARQYLKEIRYQHTETGKEYFGLGLQNEKGGWAIRNSRFKSIIALHSFTVIKSQQEKLQDDQKYRIFEGAYDFLTYLDNENLDQPKDHIIILNSLSQAKKAALYLSTIPTKNLKICLYLDNETVRSKAAENVLKAQQCFLDLTAEVYTANETYAGYKDLNNLWQAQGKYTPVIKRLFTNQPGRGGPTPDL